MPMKIPTEAELIEMERQARSMIKLWVDDPTVDIVVANIERLADVIRELRPCS